jgi:elongation factor Ts
MAITTEDIKNLREKTGAGVLECRKALVDANGDVDKACAFLREKGLAKAAKKASRAATEGIIETYVHPGAKLAVLVELDCETDFVARTDEFKTLAHDLAMQVAAAKPPYIRIEDVPADIVAAQKHEFELAIADEKKPAHIAEQIINGKLAKFYQTVCLLEQPFIKDETVKVGDLVTQTIARVGENIVVRRFARFAVGEE